MEGESFRHFLSNCIHIWIVFFLVCSRDSLFLLFLIISCPYHLINREDSCNHRSPSVHHPECQRRRSAGPAAYSWVWSALRAARQPTRTVQKTDGETGVSTRRAETSTSLRGQGVWASGWGREGGEISGLKKLTLLQRFGVMEEKWRCWMEKVEMAKSWRKAKCFSGSQMNTREKRLKSH